VGSTTGNRTDRVPDASTGATTANAISLDLFPTEIALPNGWLPEGIAIDALRFAFFGSRADGDLYRVNLITGDGSVFSQGPGTPSVGLKLDLLGRLFVAGGPGGDGRVVSAITGQILASYSFATAPTFVNDVVLTPQAAWFTDTQRAFLSRSRSGVSESCRARATSKRFRSRRARARTESPARPTATRCS
jgi:sugar lactone lactonase YvrE